jgi:hypothetical protein
MSSLPTTPARPLPQNLIWFISVAVVFHLGAILILVLGSPSGLWWLPSMGPSPAEGPQFAKEINAKTSTYYLEPLHLANNYHFASNRMQLSEAHFEAELTDDKGKKIKTIKFPDENASFWVRHRHALLAQGLAMDFPVQPRPGENIPPPGQSHPTIRIWGLPKGEPGEMTFILSTIMEHEIPRDRPVSRPSEWSLLLARSYMRYLSRRYGAASVKLVRHSRNPIFPAVMFYRELPPNMFDETVCDFGEYRREK